MSKVSHGRKKPISIYCPISPAVDKVLIPLILFAVKLDWPPPSDYVHFREGSAQCAPSGHNSLLPLDCYIHSFPACRPCAGFRHKCVDLVCVRPVEVMYIMGTGLLLLADYPCFCRRMSVKWYTLPWFSAASPTFQSRPNAHLAAPRRLLPSRHRYFISEELDDRVHLSGVCQGQGMYF